MKNIFQKIKKVVCIITVFMLITASILPHVNVKKTYAGLSSAIAWEKLVEMIITANVGYTAAMGNKSESNITAIKNDTDRLSLAIAETNRYYKYCNEIVKNKAESLVGLLTTAGYVAADTSADSLISTLDQAPPVEDWKIGIEGNSWTDEEQEIFELAKKSAESGYRASGNKPDPEDPDDKDKWQKLAAKLGKICQKMGYMCSVSLVASMASRFADIQNASEEEIASQIAQYDDYVRTVDRYNQGGYCNNYKSGDDFTGEGKVSFANTGLDLIITIKRASKTCNNPILIRYGASNKGTLTKYYTVIDPDSTYASSHAVFGPENVGTVFDSIFTYYKGGEHQYTYFYGDEDSNNNSDEYIRKGGYNTRYGVPYTGEYSPFDIITDMPMIDLGFIGRTGNNDTALNNTQYVFPSIFKSFFTDDFSIEKASNFKGGEYDTVTPPDNLQINGELKTLLQTKIDIEKTKENIGDTSTSEDNYLQNVADIYGKVAPQIKDGMTEDDVRAIVNDTVKQKIIDDAEWVNDAVGEIEQGNYEPLPEKETPVDPVDPDNPDPTDPTDPTTPTDPSDPTDPSKPTDPTTPTDITDDTPDETGQAHNLLGWIIKIYYAVIGLPSQIAERIGLFFTGAIDNIKMITTYIKLMYEQISEYLTSHTIQDIIKDIFDTMKLGLDTLGDWLSDIFDSMKQGFLDVVQWLSDTWDLIKVGFSDVVQWLKDTWDLVKQGFSDVIQWLKNLFDMIKQGFKDVIQWMKDTWDLIKQGFQDAVEWLQNIFNQIVETPQAIWNNFKEAIGNIADTIQGFFDFWKIDPDNIKKAVGKVEKFSGFDHFTTVYNLWSALDNGVIEYPKIEIDTPAIIGQFYKQPTIVLLDFGDYKTYCIWARRIFSVCAWFGFCLSAIRKFVPKFVLNA